jgi:hypothetical protein
MAAASHRCLASDRLIAPYVSAGAGSHRTALVASDRPVESVRTVPRSRTLLPTKAWPRTRVRTTPRPLAKLFDRITSRELVLTISALPTDDPRKP